MSNKNNQKKKQQQQPPQQTQQKKQEGKKQKGKKTSSKSSSVLPWLFGTFLIIGAIAGILVYDTNAHGGVFEKSTAGKFLKDTGALPYAEAAYMGTMKYSARGYKWSQKNFPIYYNSSREFMKPYVEIAVDLGKIALNGAKNAWSATVLYINTKTPIFVEFVEQYAPGLPKKTSECCCSTWSSIKTVTINTYTFMVEFFQTKVFIGSLSPENLGKMLNTTQQTLSVYCDRFHKSVDYYAKLK